VPPSLVYEGAISKAAQAGSRPACLFGHSTPHREVVVPWASCIQPVSVRERIECADCRLYNPDNSTPHSTAEEKFAIRGIHGMDVRTYF
jgi:hypothetical protein